MTDNIKPQHDLDAQKQGSAWIMPSGREALRGEPRRLLAKGYVAPIRMPDFRLPADWMQPIGR